MFIRTENFENSNYFKRFDKHYKNYYFACVKQTNVIELCRNSTLGNFHENIIYSLICK